MPRYVFPILLGLAGCAILVSLGLWQLQRLTWKEAILAEIEARITAEPVPVPAEPDAETDRFLPVAATGTTGDALFVLTSRAGLGAGHRVVRSFETADGQRLLLDEGFRPGNDMPDLPSADLSVVGNLHWPDEVDGFTPDPQGPLWFARDVPAMAAALGTEPVMIVAREIDGAADATPEPVGTEGIPNNHLGYAIQWFGLAIVWAGMTAFLLWRMRHRTR